MSSKHTVYNTVIYRNKKKDDSARLPSPKKLGREPGIATTGRDVETLLGRGVSHLSNCSLQQCHLVCSATGVDQGASWLQPAPGSDQTQYESSLHGFCLRLLSCCLNCLRALMAETINFISSGFGISPKNESPCVLGETDNNDAFHDSNPLPSIERFDTSKEGRPSAPNVRRCLRRWADISIESLVSPIQS